MNYDFSVQPPAPPNQYVTNSGPAGDDDCRTVLYGTNISESEIPANTLQSRYFAAFSDSQNRCFALTEKMLSKHLLILGGIGSGKTNTFNFIVESLFVRLTKDDVIIIFDTKGDFYKKFYNRKFSIFNLIGNDRQYEDITKSWNIFDELRDEDGTFTKRSEQTAKEISKQLFEGRESDSQPFFSQAAADLTAKVLIHLYRKAVKNHTDHLLNTPDFVGFLKTATHKTYYDMVHDPDNPDFISAETYFGKPGEKLTPQALGVFGNINAMVNDLFVGVFAESAPAGSISMRQLVRNKGGKILFIEYDLSVGETLGPMYRIIYDLALKEALGGREHRGNVFMITDEWKLLPNLMHFDDALNFGRSLGIKLICGLQSIRQLYDIYGEDRAKAMLSGFMNCFCFQAEDYDTRQFIVDRFGETYENLHFTVGTEPINTQREGHTVEDWDVLKLDIGQAYIKLNMYKPFLFKFRDFDKPHSVL